MRFLKLHHITTSLTNQKNVQKLIRHPVTLTPTVSLKAIGEFGSFENQLPILFAWCPAIYTVLTFTISLPASKTKKINSPSIYPDQRSPSGREGGSLLSRFHIEAAVASQFSSKTLLCLPSVLLSVCWENTSFPLCWAISRISSDTTEAFLYEGFSSEVPCSSELSLHPVWTSNMALTI